MRLFVGLGLPEGLAARLATLEAGLPGAQWVLPENMHLTLRFIGEVTENDAADIDEMLAGISAPGFDLHLQGVGTFGEGHKTRAVWVGLVPSAPLAHLQTKVESACVRGGQPPEGRKFSPHVTLARFNHAADANRLQRFIEGSAMFSAGPWTVDHFTLFESRLGKSGAVYTPLADYELSPPVL